MSTNHTLISMTTKINPLAFFNHFSFCSFYEEKMKHKKGGGLDRLTPVKFYHRYVDEFEDIAKRCCNGTYEFSPYREKLILKGREKFPRMLSVPSMRDRMVLGELNLYLQNVFPEAVNHDVPNKYINDVADFLAERSSETIYFFKTDIKGFFDNIHLNTLYGKLETRIEAPILQLVKAAIETVTIASDSPKTVIRRQERKNGIPQGLAISNILAYISMLDFDESIKVMCDTNTVYKRYVDDILILSTSRIDASFVDKFKNELNLQCVSLELSSDKTQYGVVGNAAFDYLGYMIKSVRTISVRNKNVQSYLNRISRLIARYKTQKTNKNLRPRFICQDKEFDDYYVSLINQKLAGVKISHHLFGWLPYFQAMTDIHQLYEIDTVVHRKFMKGLDIASRIKSLPKVYWDIKKNAGKHTLMDYDALTDIADIQNYLLSKGLIDEDVKYDDEDIMIKYMVHLDRLKKDAMISIGTTS